MLIVHFCLGTSLEIIFCKRVHYQMNVLFMYNLMFSIQFVQSLSFCLVHVILFSPCDFVQSLSFCLVPVILFSPCHIVLLCHSKPHYDLFSVIHVYGRDVLEQRINKTINTYKFKFSTIAHKTIHLNIEYEIVPQVTLATRFSYLSRIQNSEFSIICNFHIFVCSLIPCTDQNVPSDVICNHLN